MNKEINEDVLIILKKEKVTGKIIIDYVPIINPLINEINKAIDICKRASSKLSEIAAFINKTTKLQELNSEYKYSIDLTGRNQIFTFSNEEEINKINKTEEIISLQKKLDENFKESDVIDSIKKEIINDYSLCAKAYSIKLAYRICFEDKTILTFSHRITGWSNPTNQLNENFSFQFLTNFGYGNSSYFYTLLKYKNIEISAFSEWINYFEAKASTILRYSKNHAKKKINKYGQSVVEIKNNYWSEAMNFASNACYLFLINEKEFINKYIILECEKMVSGLERFLNEDKFIFQDENRRIFEENNVGHKLIQFKGEKISGALEFLNKISEFKDVMSVDGFFKRIENCNLSIRPILLKELIILNNKLNEFKTSIAKIKPEYENVIRENNLYNSVKNDIINQIVISRKINRSKVDLAEIEQLFRKQIPHYDKFNEHYNRIINDYNYLNEQLIIHMRIFENIAQYEKNISTYFSNRNKNT